MSKCEDMFQLFTIWALSERVDSEIKFLSIDNLYQFIVIEGREQTEGITL